MRASASVLVASALLASCGLPADDQAESELVANEADDVLVPQSAIAEADARGLARAELDSLIVAIAGEALGLSPGDISSSPEDTDVLDLGLDSLNLLEIFSTVGAPYDELAAIVCGGESATLGHLTSIVMEARATKGDECDELADELGEC